MHQQEGETSQNNAGIGKLEEDRKRQLLWAETAYHYGFEKETFIASLYQRERG